MKFYTDSSLNSQTPQIRLSEGLAGSIRLGGIISSIGFSAAGSTSCLQSQNNQSALAGNHRQATWWNSFLFCRVVAFICLFVLNICCAFCCKSLDFQMALLPSNIYYIRAIIAALMIITCPIACLSVCFLLLPLLV